MEVRVGLTGGMGCGKSTASSLFRDRGWRSVDSDAVVHELLARDLETIAQVVELCGPEVALADGGVDRAAVGRLVFADAAMLEQLEAILHPKVRRRWETATEEGGDWVVEIPLLFEKNLQNKVDLSVCVFCHPETQAKRLEQRGMNRAQALARMNRQWPIADKAERADYVLLNDGNPEFLAEQVEILVRHLKTLQ